MCSAPFFHLSTGSRNDGLPVGFGDEIDADRRSIPGRLAQGLGAVRVDNQQSPVFQSLKPRSRHAEFIGKQPVEQPPANQSGDTKQQGDESNDAAA